ncbi:MAG: hypothetical protein JXR73_08640 [Candidatus Omnitrophica bacterium]|nr:hypothetical protein [Candidatus Omnitrophota bacterium]
MQTEEQIRDKIRKIQALFERAGTEGERIAAGAALHRMQNKLSEVEREEQPIEMKFTLGNPWSSQLFLALCRRYSLKPFRYRGQRRTTVMLLVKESFVDVTLWPEFEELDKVLMGYLNSITNRLIAEEIYGEVKEAEER